jgi:hypothetical protein
VLVVAYIFRRSGDAEAIRIISAREGVTLRTLLRRRLGYEAVVLRYTVSGRRQMSFTPRSSVTMID